MTKILIKKTVTTQQEIEIEFPRFFFNSGYFIRADISQYTQVWICSDGNSASMATYDHQSEELANPNAREITETEFISHFLRAYEIIKSKVDNLQTA